MNAAERVLLLTALELKITAVISRIRSLLCFSDDAAGGYGQTEITSALLRMTEKGLIYESDGKLLLQGQIQEIATIMQTARTAAVFISGKPEIPALCGYFSGESTAVIMPRDPFSDVVGLFLLEKNQFCDFLRDGGWLPEARYQPDLDNDSTSEYVPDRLERYLQEGISSVADFNEPMAMLIEVFDLETKLVRTRKLIYNPDFRWLTASGDNALVFPYGRAEMDAWISSLYDMEVCDDFG